MKFKDFIKDYPEVNLVKICHKIGKGTYTDKINAILEYGNMTISSYSVAGSVVFVIFKEDDWNAVV